MKRYKLVIFFTLVLICFFSFNVVLAENYPFEGIIFADSLGVHNAPTSYGVGLWY